MKKQNVMKEFEKETPKNDPSVDRTVPKVAKADIRPAIHHDLSCAVSMLHLMLNQKEIFDKVVVVIEEHYREKGMLVEDPAQTELNLQK